MFTFAFDPSARILTITGEGLWSLSTLTAFSAEALARGGALRLRHGQFAVLNDVRKMPIQLPEVARGLEILTAKSAAITTAPIAVVVGSVLSKIQVERVVNAPNTKAFLTIEEAKAWLALNWTVQAAA
ncbi:MAG: hypothetical protein ACK4ZY_14350 [Sphingomonas sp.]